MHKNKKKWKIGYLSEYMVDLEYNLFGNITYYSFNHLIVVWFLLTSSKLASRFRMIKYADSKIRQYFILFKTSMCDEVTNHIPRLNALL